MNYAIGCLTFAAALVACPAQATTQVSGTSSWSFGPDWVVVSNANRIAVTEIAPGNVSEEEGYDPSAEDVVRFRIAITTPVSDVAYAGAPLALSTVETHGGAKLATPLASALTLRGNLEVKDLTLDLDNKRVYATLTGNFSGVANHTYAPLTSNVISTVENVHLFDFQTISGSTTLSIGNTVDFTVGGLSITQTGFDHFVSSLRFYSTGRALLATISDYGSITTSITAVPEPSAYALTLAGMAMVVAAKRVRRAKFA